MPPEQSFQLEQIDLYNGDCKLFTTATSGGNWYVKIRVPGHRNGIRKSLRTKDERAARALAEKEYLDLRARIQSGQAIFQPKLKEIVQDYIEYKALDVDSGLITEGRLNTIKTQLKHLERFVGDNYKSILAIHASGDYFRTYVVERQKHNPTPTNTTLINEMSTITAVYKRAMKKGKIPFTCIPDFPSLRKDNNRREALTLQQLNTITTHMRTKEFLEFDKDNLHRYFVRDFVGLLSNTGIRFGEARRLKWKHIKVVKGKKETNKRDWIVEIELSENMTKNKKARTVQGRGGHYVERIKSYSKYTKPNDFIFVDNHSGQQLDKHYYYRAWGAMLSATGLDKNNFPITYYNLRHTYSTIRLYTGADPYILAQNLGTGLTYLENHYGQTKTKIMRSQLTKELDPEVRDLLREE